MNQVLLFIYLLEILGCAICIDQGQFLWKDTDGNLVDNGKKQIKPQRWTRSLYKWLHSPLINSVEELIEVDDARAPIPTTEQNMHLVKDYTERFEEEFFLWQDSEGNPLKFGLKQIEESGNVPLLEKNSQEEPLQKESQRFSPVWQNPLLYEDNNDLEDDSHDSQLLSLHDEAKLNKIFKNKFESFFSFLYPKKTADRNESHLHEIREKEFSGKTMSHKISGLFKKGFNSPKYTNDSTDNHKQDRIEDKISKFHSIDKLDNTGNAVINRVSSKHTLRKQIYGLQDDPFLNKYENSNSSNTNSKESSAYYPVNKNNITIEKINTHYDEPNAPNAQNLNIAEVQDELLVGNSLTQTKWNLIENSHGDTDWNDADEIHIDKSTGFCNELNQNRKHHRRNRKSRRVRKHQIKDGMKQPHLRDFPSSQYELYGTISN